MKEIINENRNLFNREIDAGSYFLQIKNCPSMLKTNQVTVYVWKKHASMTRFI